MACLRSFSRRCLSPKWFCSQTSRPLLRHIKDDTEPSSSDPSLLFRRFHRQIFLEHRTQMSFVKPVGSGGLLARQMSSSSFKPEESCIKIDALGNVAEKLTPEKSVEAMATTIDGCSAAIGNFSFPENCVHYVINGVHELTGFNWWMSIILTAFLVNGLTSPVFMRMKRQAWEILGRSIQKVKRVIQTCDPKALANNRKLEARLKKKLREILLLFLNLVVLDASIYISFIKGIRVMANKIPGFENGGIYWFIDLSTTDSFYILPLVTGLTFWLTAEIHISRSNILSSMKRLPLILTVFIAAQATFEYEVAVYFYLIPSRIYISTLFMILTKLRSIPGQRQKIMGRMRSLMREFINVLKKKDKM